MKSLWEMTQTELVNEYSLNISEIEKLSNDIWKDNFCKEMQDLLAKDQEIKEVAAYRYLNC